MGTDCRAGWSREPTWVTTVTQVRGNDGLGPRQEMARSAQGWGDREKTEGDARFERQEGRSLGTPGGHSEPEVPRGVGRQVGGARGPRLTFLSPEPHQQTQPRPQGCIRMKWGCVAKRVQHRAGAGFPLSLYPYVDLGFLPPKPESSSSRSHLVPSPPPPLRPTHPFPVPGAWRPKHLLAMTHSGLHTALHGSQPTSRSWSHRPQQPPPPGSAGALPAPPPLP